LVAVAEKHAHALLFVLYVLNHIMIYNYQQWKHFRHKICAEMACIPFQAVSRAESSTSAQAKRMEDRIVMALEEIKRRGYVSRDLAEAENSAIASALAAPDRHIASYIQDARSFNGRYVCADLFKETFAIYASSKESKGRYNGAVHNSAAVLAAEQFRRMLADDLHPDRDKAIFLTGSPGAGKTSSILASGELDPDTRVIFEGQLSNPATSIEKIQQALDAGLHIKIMVVHPLPENALDNTLKRYYQDGRGASIEVMAGIQGRLPASLEAVHDKFGDAVSLTIFDRRDFSDRNARHQAASSANTPVGYTTGIACSLRRVPLRPAFPVTAIRVCR
jgi:hypothetical protein